MRKALDVDVKLAGSGIDPIRPSTRRKLRGHLGGGDESAGKSDLAPAIAEEVKDPALLAGLVRQHGMSAFRPVHNYRRRPGEPLDDALRHFRRVKRSQIGELAFAEIRDVKEWIRRTLAGHTELCLAGQRLRADYIADTDWLRYLARRQIADHRKVAFCDEGSSIRNPHLASQCEVLLLTTMLVIFQCVTGDQEISALQDVVL